MGGDEAEQIFVVEEQEAEDQDQVIEEGVVGGENDAYLPWGNNEKADQANAAREKEHEDDDELHDERCAYAGGVEPVGQVFGVPADPRWHNGPFW